MAEVRRAGYVAVGATGLLGAVWGLLRVGLSFRVPSIEGTLLVIVLAMSALLSAAVALWIALHRPPKKDAFALAVGLAGFSVGTNILPVPDQAVVSAIPVPVKVAVVDLCIMFGIAGFLRFFTLFPRPITPSLEPHQIRRATTEQKRRKMERELERSIWLVRAIQGDRLWLAAAALGAVFAVGASATAVLAPDTERAFMLALLPGMMALGWGGPLAVAAVTQSFLELTGEELRA